jgi:hypothetical protein
MTDRCLSGVYVRVQRNGKWLSKDFTDLTEEEMRAFLTKKENPEWTTNLAIELAKTIRKLGDQFDIVTMHEEYEDD